MNNSFERLIDGMVESLRRDIIPATQGEFVRGQAFGVIFLLESLKRRASWSPAFLGEQVAALTELREALDAIVPPPGMPRLLPIGDASEAARDTGDGEVAALIDWLAHNPCRAASAAIDCYLTRQIRHELTTSAKPMFAEISLGREQEEAPR
ncbi:MAG: hypothetical protein JWR80_3026 [Bradyrhizobium sp.]|nr:hypothetical protein [Bradyrhizobium sp.]